MKNPLTRRDKGNPMLRLAVAALIAVISLLPGSGAALAQAVNFGQRADPKAPVEVTADALQVDQKSGQVVYSGNVVIAQGSMRLTADKVVLSFTSGDKRKIAAMSAEGHVMMVNGPDAAEAQSAQYRVDSGQVLLSGDVVLTQGDSVLAGEKVTVDLASGTASVSGRVRSILQTGEQ